MKLEKTRNYPQITASVLTISTFGPIWGLCSSVSTDRARGVCVCTSLITMDK
jgi:hypothetical protein